MRFGQTFLTSSAISTPLHIATLVNTSARLVTVNSTLSCHKATGSVICPISSRRGLEATRQHSTRLPRLLVQVRAVKLRRDRIVVAQEYCVYVYNFSNLKVVKKFETRSNPMGLLAVSNTTAAMTLVAPGMEPGVVSSRRGTLLLRAVLSTLRSG